MQWLRRQQRLTRRCTLLVEEVTEEIDAELLERINKYMWYAIQVDESTDTNKVISLIYVSLAGGYV